MNVGMARFVNARAKLYYHSEFLSSAYVGLALARSWGEKARALVFSLKCRFVQRSHSLLLLYYFFFHVAYFLDSYSVSIRE